MAAGHGPYRPRASRPVSQPTPARAVVQTPSTGEQYLVDVPHGHLPERHGQHLDRAPWWQTLCYMTKKDDSTFVMVSRARVAVLGRESC